MEVLAMVAIGIVLIAGLSRKAGNRSGSQKSQPRDKGKQVIIRKNGKQIRYRINRYGEIFEE